LKTSAGEFFSLSFLSLFSLFPFTIVPFSRFHSASRAWLVLRL
jgi:hypothetical protein